MKLSLVVTQGTAQGKVIPITVPQFLIGRDPQCLLRPNSPAVSKRHCTLFIRQGKAYVKDFNSTNGTFVNDHRVQGEHELANGDKFRVGPLLFEVRIVATPPVDKPTPLPAQKPMPPVDDDEAIGDMLLSMQDDEKLDLGAVEGEPSGGNTTLEIPLPAEAPADPAPKADASPTPPNAPKKATPDPKKMSETQSAAMKILAAMNRRNRK